MTPVAVVVRELFFIVAVNVMLLPTVTGSGVWPSVMDKSAERVVVVPILVMNAWDEPATGVGPEVSGFNVGKSGEPVAPVR